MSLPPEVAAAAEAALREFCEHHSSADIADRLRYAYQITGTTAFLIEQRPGFMKAAEWSSVPVAKFKFSAARNDWSLYWSESNGRWRRLSNAPANSDLRKLIKIVADDVNGVFSKG
jgi:hypothetical protein